MKKWKNTWRFFFIVISITIAFLCIFILYINQLSPVIWTELRVGLGLLVTIKSYSKSYSIQFNCYVLFLLLSLCYIIQITTFTILLLLQCIHTSYYAITLLCYYIMIFIILYSIYDVKLFRSKGRATLHVCVYSLLNTAGGFALYQNTRQ